MFANYYQVRAWLEDFIPLVYGKEELGLSRIRYLLKLLGNPEKKFKSIHVAGTSGKGSTAYYIARLLQYSSKSEIRNPKSETNSNFQNPKYKKSVSKFEIRYSSFPTKVGLHISPHLVDIRERMQIFENLESRIQNLESSSLMPMGRFLRLFNEIKPVVEKIQKEKPDLTPSYFEILVAASFKYFAEEKVDWAVVEVGLGGRLDATNVLQSRIAVITNIGLDHTEILGDTIEKIAFEKSGIIKAGVPVVTGATGDALKVIADVAKSQKAKVISQKFKSKGKIWLNFVIAQKAVEIALKSQGDTLQISKEAPFDFSFPGRFEEVDEGVIIDGAHNPDKVHVLIQWIKTSQQLTVNSQLTLVLAFKKGKDWGTMVDLLIKNLPIKKIIATEFQAVTDTGRFGTVPAEDIAGYIDSRFKQSLRSSSRQGGTAGLKMIDVRCVNNSQEAVFSALQSTIVLVTGSLYLVGEVRTMWKLPEF